MAGHSAAVSTPFSINTTTTTGSPPSCAERHSVRVRGRSAGEGAPRRPADGSELNCDLPHLAAQISPPVVDVVGKPVVGAVGQRSPPLTSTAVSCVDSALMEATGALPSTPSSLSARAVVPAPLPQPSPSSPSLSSPHVQQQVATALLRCPPSPTLLPPWVYAISEHLGPRLPSPSEQTMRAPLANTTDSVQADAGGGEVPTLRADMMRPAVEPPHNRTPLSHRPPTLLLSPHLLRFSSHSRQRHNLENEVFVVNAAELSPLPRTPGSGMPASLSLRFNAETDESPLSFYGGRTSVPADAAAELDGSTQPALPNFIVPVHSADVVARSANWRLERAVQQPPTVDYDFTEQERSLASLFAADEMSKSRSHPSSSSM